MSIKMLREAVCREQVRSGEWPENIRNHVAVLIELIDIHRPIGVDGKHGKRHTETCGCEDK